MHFFYLDETGCTGADLNNPEQPIFVLGGISVRDEGWRTTTADINGILRDYFDGELPAGFELHSHELLNLQGAFDGHEREAVNQLVHRILDKIVERSHAVHYVGVDKARLAAALPGPHPPHQVVRTDIPYLLAFNYMVSYIERYVRDALGRSARGMIILDIKDGYQGDIDAITHFRRYEVAQARRLKWLVEFSYPVDSVRHPMIQISDLVIYIVRKFLELENGYRDAWPEVAKDFYAGCFEKILPRVRWSNLIDMLGREEVPARALLASSHARHRQQWRRHYNLPA